MVNGSLLGQYQNLESVPTKALQGNGTYVNSGLRVGLVRQDTNGNKNANSQSLHPHTSLNSLPKKS